MEPVLIVVAYLIGAIPFGLIIARVFGKIDIRQHGSGNIGATNVGRVLGFQWFIVVFVLDALKGLLPTLAFKLLLKPDAGFFWTTHGPVLAGLAAILGHMFPCYLKFKGGKGVATGLGVIVILAPKASLVAAGMFLLTMCVWQTVSISSILAATSFGLTEVFLLKPHPFTAENWVMGVFSILIPTLINYQHRSNIRRLMQGEEKTITQSDEEQKPDESS